MCIRDSVKTIYSVAKINENNRSLQCKQNTDQALKLPHLVTTELFSISKKVIQEEVNP